MSNKLNVILGQDLVNHDKLISQSGKEPEKVGFPSAESALYKPPRVKPVTLASRLCSGLIEPFISFFHPIVSYYLSSIYSLVRCELNNIPMFMDMIKSSMIQEKGAFIRMRGTPSFDFDIPKEGFYLYAACHISMLTPR